MLGEVGEGSAGVRHVPQIRPPNDISIEPIQSRRATNEQRTHMRHASRTQTLTYVRGAYFAAAIGKAPARRSVEARMRKSTKRNYRRIKCVRHVIACCFARFHPANAAKGNIHAEKISSCWNFISV